MNFINTFWRPVLYLVAPALSILVIAFKPGDTSGSYPDSPVAALPVSGYCQPEERSRWFPAPTGKPAGVVLLIHGMNQNPSIWGDMILLRDTFYYRATGSKPSHVIPDKSLDF